MEALKKYPLYLEVVDEIVKKYTYGDVIPKDWLLENLELSPPESGTFEEIKKYQLNVLSVLEPLKETLLAEHDMLLNNIRGQGYLIVVPEQQSEVVWDKMKTNFGKEFRRAVKGLVNIDINQLSDTAKMYNHDCQAKLAALRAHQSACLTEPVLEKRLHQFERAKVDETPKTSERIITPA